MIRLVDCVVSRIHISVDSGILILKNKSPDVSGSDLLYKIPGLTQILHWITCVGNGIGSKISA